MSNTSAESKQFKTSDGASLHYLEAGSGLPLVMIPGWSQSAEQFKYQIDGLSDRYRCIAVDMRGHGDSEKLGYGYKIQRFAKDVYELLTALRLCDVALLGHSMGCSVIWCYWDLFGADRLGKMILIDEPAFLISNPTWTKAELESSGALFDLEALINTCNNLAGPDGKAHTIEFIGRSVTDSISEEEKAWIIQLNLKLPRQHAATLLYNHCAQDWRDVIPRIDIPTLVVGGEASQVPWKSQVWIHDQIPGSKFVLFKKDEGGGHFMFIEGSGKFNKVVADFLG